MNRVLIAFAFCVTAAAHEIGTSRVNVLLKQDHTFDIELVTDAAALAEKLETVAGREPSAISDASQLRKLFADSDDIFRQRANISFDGMQVQPQVTYTVEPANGPGTVPCVIIHLKGAIPQAAHNFTWSYSWTFASYAISIRSEGAKAVTEWLDGGDTSRAYSLLTPEVDQVPAVWRYLSLGFTHIVPNGLDHMLFVLGIYLLSRRTRDVLLQVSAFTVAHSITLGLSLYGLVSVPPRIVEPLIAISIAYVAIENMFLSELKTWRVALVFAFGLLHGLGFAGALHDLSLSRSEFATALLMFNVGVEGGQLAVIAAAFLLFGWLCAQQSWYRSRIVVPASMMIACMAIFWTVERLIA